MGPKMNTMEIMINTHSYEIELLSTKCLEIHIKDTCLLHLLNVINTFGYLTCFRMVKHTACSKNILTIGVCMINAQFFVSNDFRHTVVAHYNPDSHAGSASQAPPLSSPQSSSK